MPDSVEQLLDSLAKMSRTKLESLWQQLFKSEPPTKIRNTLLRRVIAYRLQDQEFGGLSGARLRQRRQIATALEADPKATVSTRPRIKPGTRLVREWKQQVHTVEADVKGYEYRGAHYGSLSEIARLITGTRWSGPLFFGLKAKQSSALMEL